MATRYIIPVLGDELVLGNYFDGCRFDPDATSGEEARPFTTLYWNFIDRHRSLLESNRGKPSAERDSIVLRASSIFDKVSGGQL